MSSSSTHVDLRRRLRSLTREQQINHLKHWIAVVKERIDSAPTGPEEGAIKFMNIELAARQAILDELEKV